MPKSNPAPGTNQALQFLGQQAEAHWQDFSVSKSSSQPSKTGSRRA
ncbi:hypothetical protein ACNKHP_18680 [Shigella boydii]